MRILTEKQKYKFGLSNSMFEGDEKLLRKLSKECKDSTEKIRYLALHALSKGHSVTLVSEIFCTDDSTIYRWIERWHEEKSMHDKPKSGRPPTLLAEDKKEIKKLLKENNPSKHGINASFWDTKELHLYFHNQGKMFSRETIRLYLKHIGARYVKSQIQYPEADLEEQKEFAKKFFSEKEKGSAVILFHDEMSAACSAHKGYGWTLDKRLVVKAPQRYRQRLNCFGAVNPIDGEIIEMSSKESKAPAFVRFLRNITKKYQNKKIVVYLDNLPVHKSAKVKRFIGMHPNIRLEYIPPYSPELNIQEQWWNYKRMKFLNNRNFRSTQQLAISMNRFTKQTSREQIMSICNFERLERLLQ